MNAYDYFDYKDGKLYWKVSTNRKIVVGAKAGVIFKNGREYVQINGKRYLSYRLIFAMHHGYFPKQIDHIDNDFTNNCIQNLREATSMQNQTNTRKQKNNTSGYKNVSWDKKVSKWHVHMNINKKHKSFGFYDDIELAGLVAVEARNKHHGEFANHG